ncbi:MAG: beta galactosidase jelly roll domain-containing protein [Bacteroidales bacterium]|nr:beta galactosidase jelly roll domain-containing protein [Bacteroidales bacterium]
MNRKNTSICRYTIALLLLIPVLTYSNVTLPKLISDGLVLQRDAEVKIWGWADSLEQVRVDFLDSTYQTRANETGEWNIILAPLKASGPHSMKIQANNTITLNNILVGDVWICSGQSNMELNMERARPLYETEIANSKNEYIRYFEVPRRYNFNAPQKDLVYGHWLEANPKNLLRFSAVSYFFALELYNKYHVPVGLINTALGGSPVEAWISEDAIKVFPKYYEELQQFKNAALIEEIEAKDNKRSTEWYSRLWKNDEGYKNPEQPWYSPNLNTEDWQTMQVPGFWADEETGDVNGVLWFRKNINVPASMAGKQAKLLLGRIVDADSVYVNGTFVGTVSYQYPPRRYVVPEGVLKAGENSIVVRVISNIGKGGFIKDKPYELSVDEQKIDLTGEWKYKLGAKMEPLEGPTFIRWKPVGLFNAMIAPLLNYPIKGVIWYQGESNADRSEEYQDLFSTLITNWREKWQQGDFPFLFVQLPNFMEAKDQPSESDWALLREAQQKTLALPNTAMAVAIDIGEWNDIHPLNKKDVAYRLGLAAEKVAYNNNEIMYSGPVYESMKIKKNKIILSFSNTGSGLEAKGGGELKNFAIAGADKKFIWAEAKIKNNTIIVWNTSVNKPVAVRYAWADNPDGANLYNKEGLPASPFRTDSW